MKCVGKLSLLVIVSGSCLLHLGGCSVQVKGRPRPLVKMGRVRGELELSMEEYTDESTSSGTTQKDVTRIFEEELRLETQGDVYHPNLMTYFAMLGLGLKQQSFDSNGETDSVSGTFSRYQVNMNFLPLKPYPFSVNFSKSDTLAPRRFRSPLRVETSSVGAAMKLRVPDWPMAISWTSTQTEQTSGDPDDANLYARSSETLSYELLHDFSEYSHLDFRADWDKNSQKRGSSSNDTSTGRYRLEHDLAFGSDRQHRLDSSLGFLDKSGDFATQTLHWSENLILNHSDSFSTFYNGVFSMSTFSSATSQTTAGTAGFYHRLYDSLVTRGDVFTSSTEFGSDSNTTWIGGGLQFDYTRSNPWGRLSSEYSIRLANTEQSGESGTAFVIDESHTADTLTEFTLDERNIDLSSIVVTDSTGTDIYTEGDDYTVTVVGDQVEILADDTGVTLPNITDGQELLVDYFFEIVGSTEEDTVDQSFRIEQEFDNGLSLYYSHDRRDEQITSSVDTAATPDDFRKNTVGVGYKTKRILLRAEHSRLTSPQDSVGSTRLSANYTWPLTPGTLLTAGVSQSWVESEGDNDPTETSLFKAKGRIKARLSKHLRLLGDAQWRNENSTDSGRTAGLEMGIAVEYIYRALSLKAGWDSYSLDRRDTQTNSSTFYFRLIRRF